MTSTSLSSKGKYIFATVILFIFIISNLMIIMKKEIFIDEVISLKLVQTLPMKELVKGVDVHFGYYILMKLLPHNSVYMLRLYSLVMMAVAIALLFTFNDRLFGAKVAMLTMIASAFSATISYYAIEARMYALLFLLSVILMYNFLKKNYNIAILILSFMITIHYYAIFMAVPVFVSLLFLKKTFVSRFAVVCVLAVLVILSPIIYHQLTDNPYKITPPSQKVTLISLPSLIIFPFLDPSDLHSYALIAFALMIVGILVYLMLTFDYKDNGVRIFFFYSAMTLFIIFSSSLLGAPYQHRYTMIFFPMFYTMLAISFMRLNLRLKVALGYLLSVFIIIGFLSYHVNVPSQLKDISAQIKCPKNILHETPFSMLPMMLYLPDCNHYIAYYSDWEGLTYKTVFSTPDKVNNSNIDYDVYISYYGKLVGTHILDNTCIDCLKVINVVTT